MTEDISKFYFEDSAGFLLYRTAIAAKAALRREFQNAGLDVTPEQWTVLCALWEEDGLSQGELAGKTVKDKTTITRILDLLEKKGLAVRRRQESDRRVYEIYLTEEGRNLREKLTPVFTGLHARLNDGISEQEVQLMILILKKLLSNCG
ncbi:MAG: MarR family transcriptional regulator [Pseudomonadota bacterium]